MAMTFPNESATYRVARDALLASEIALKRQMEAVATELRSLPPGGEVARDYAFERIGPQGIPEVVRMSDLFRGGDTLMIYHYMFPRHSQDDRPGPTSGLTANIPLDEEPCPSCTALIDMWEGTMPHFEGLGGNLVIVTKAPIKVAAAFAKDKQWKHIRLVSAAGNSFRRDYGGENDDGQPVPIMTVFKRGQDGVIRLHWASEMVQAESDPGQDMRHLGTVEPLWTLFDLTPNGRPPLNELMDYPCCHTS